MTHIARRRLLQGAALIPAAGAFVPAAEASCVNPIPTKFNETYDVVVIGSGFAGLAAALAAHEAGAKTAVFEKMAFIGGNSSLSGGMLAVPGSSVQKAQSIKDSPEALEADMERIGLGLGDPAHIRFVCEKASETFEWTRKVIGVEWDENLTGKGGHSASRCMITKQGTGQGIIVPAVAKLKAAGVPIRTGCFMEAVLRDADGRVKGVRIREGYVFGKPGSGKVRNICAKRAVILACGGFGADVRYRKTLDPKLGEAFLTTNQPGATAEAWREASRIGARIIQADWIQCLPSCSPLEQGMGITTHFASISGSLFGFWLSTLSSSRFVNEFGDRKLCTDAILTVINKGGQALAFSDDDGVKHLETLRPGLFAKMLDAGTVEKFADADALAKAYRMDPAKLRAAIAEYNDNLAKKSDPKFGRRFDKAAKPIGSGPYYVSRMSPKVHHCMGGVATAINTAVLDVMTDKPIPGLFAAGEFVGGIHGAVRIGACAVMDCLVNGREAGMEAAKSKAWI